MRIEYEDQDLLVVYKEAGLPVQTARTSRKDLVSLLKNHLMQTGKRETRKGEGTPEPYLGIVHRLDQPVEGLLVFAKTPKSASALSRQAASKEGMEKVYQAIVCLDAASYPMAIEGMKREVTLVDWLGRDTASNTAYITSENEKGAKRAELVFRTLWIRESRALLEIRLLTGRHHQIRIQMAHAGMSLLGDRKYGDERNDGTGKEVPSIKSAAEGTGKGQPFARLCLCACRLSFVHPVSGKKMQFIVEPTFSEEKSSD